MNGEISGLNLRVILLYGRRGKTPERRPVIVHKIEIGRNDDGGPVATMIEGYCQLRKAPRSFLVASILEMADGTTGEIVPHPSAWLLGQAVGYRQPQMVETAVTAVPAGIPQINRYKLSAWKQVVIGLVFAGTVATLFFYNSSPPAAQSPPPTGLAAAQRPAAQLRFCEIINAATAAYVPAREEWYAEKNPIAQDRMTPKLAAMRDQRDRAVLELLGKAKPHMDGWILHLIDMSTGPANPSRFDMTLTARCQSVVTMKSEFDLEPAQADMLAKLQKGDYLRISGDFLSHDAAHNPAARALDWDGFEGTAMETPTYRFLPTEISDH